MLSQIFIQNYNKVVSNRGTSERKTSKNEIFQGFSERSNDSPKVNRGTSETKMKNEKLVDE